MDEYTFANTDYLILVAAGNAGPKSSSVGTPATAKNILSVGASDYTASQYRSVHV